MLEKVEAGVGFKAMFLWPHCPGGGIVCADAIPSAVHVMDVYMKEASGSFSTNQYALTHSETYFSF